jgi:hypothetical protein
MDFTQEIRTAMIRFRKYKTDWTSAKYYGIVLDHYRHRWTLDVYFGHRVFVAFWDRAL